MKILITGVSGTGKSTICNELNKINYISYDIENENLGLCHMIRKDTKKISKDYDEHNLESIKQHDWVCDIDKLNKLMSKNPKGIIFYCGTTSNLDDIIPMFDKIFLLKVDNEVLRKRLSKRTSNEFARTADIQEWVFSWKDWWEEHMIKKGAIVINANKNLKETINDIIKKV